jgi:hypothetical protein
MREKILFIVFCLTFIIGDNYAQPDPPQTSAESAIVDLKEGAAIVRLYMNNPKLVKLREIKNRPGTSKEERNRMDIEIDKHIQDRRDYAKQVIQNFTEYYDFSQVYFMPDSLFREFLNGRRDGIFLNDNADLDPESHLEIEQFLIFGRGNRDEDFIVLRRDGTSMPSAFPDRANFNVVNGVTLLFGNRMRKTIERLNKNHHSFYERVKQ